MKIWKSQKEGLKESLDYLKGRKEGLITSIKTPWVKFNDATTDGIEWNTLTVVAGRPGSGKTLIKDQIIREAFVRNPGETFNVLEFQLEMLARMSAVREYSAILGKSYKYLCSADGILADEDLQRCYEYAKKKVNLPIDIVENSVTAEEFKAIIEEYMEDKKVLGKYTKTIITLDHSILLKKKNGQQRLDALADLGEVLTELKRKYPILFIILSQLNRNIDNPERNEDGKYGNYVLESDIFGGDSLLQHADTVIGINRPAKQKIRFYGPDRFIIEDETVLVMHFLKCRNGDTRMSFFKAEFNKMKITESETPPQAKIKL
jgi:replicative DNA helicase